jgi:prepilin-type N-terminal cleavage/methylation domain-containing protein
MDMLKDRNNNGLRGFTLAEVLITLGIIGVVAAITIPLLIQNSNSKKFITQFKKSLSTLNQAAINAQAQYDMDYSLLGTLNQDSACATDALSKGQDTLCGLLNNTLSGHTYQGKYGVVKGADSSTPYQADVSSFAITDFLIFSFADGAFVAFNPNAVNCSLASGSVISTEMVTSGNLANCLGFIDVNGSQFPNKEIKCSEGDTELSVNSTCKVTNRSMGDIFPIVFHDGVVEPITNASLSVINGGDGKEEVTPPKPKTAAQLAAEKVTNENDRQVLLDVDMVKEMIAQKYREDGIADIDSWPKNHGFGNTGVYDVKPKSDGTYEIKYVGMNNVQNFHNVYDVKTHGYRVYINGDNIKTSLRMGEKDGQTRVYAAAGRVYVNQWNRGTIEAGNWEI